MHEFVAENQITKNSGSTRLFKLKGLEKFTNLQGNWQVFGISLTVNQ